MPEVMDYQKIMQEIWLKYDDSPEGWTFLQVDSPRKDRMRLYFSNGEDTWYIEVFAAANGMKGKGTKFKNKTIQEFVEENDFDVNSGIRPLSKQKLKKFVKKDDIPEKEIEKVFEADPKSTGEIKSKIGIVGPQYVISDDNIQLSSSQRDLQRKLSRMVDDFEKDQLRYIG